MTCIQSVFAYNRKRKSERGEKCSFKLPLCRLSLKSRCPFVVVFVVESCSCILFHSEWRLLLKESIPKITNQEYSNFWRDVWQLFFGKGGGGGDGWGKWSFKTVRNGELWLNTFFWNLIMLYGFLEENEQKLKLVSVHPLNNQKFNQKRKLLLWTLRVLNGIFPFPWTYQCNATSAAPSVFILMFHL